MYNNTGGLVGGRYRAGNEVGKGAFARVYRSIDTHSNKEVAMKILKRDFARDAIREVEVLSAINKHDPDQKQRICRMLANFTWQGQPCIIFNLAGPALRTRKFGTGDKAEVARFARQIAKALDYCHYTCRIVHTDLKPENILLDNPNPGHSGLGDGWRICDLGSASFFTGKPDKELITTRPYRAPEVILGSGWCYPADMFSLGVILYEVMTGRTLFESTRYCDSDSQHLQQMERRLGTLQPWMVDGASSKARNAFFDASGRLRPSHLGSNVQQPISVGDADLQDLLLRLVHYDPVTRFRADEVSHHPFITKYLGPADEPVHASMPSNAYSAGYIRTPGCASQRNGRAPANKHAPREEGDRMGAEVRGRSSSMRIAKDRAPTSNILGDLTNRPAAGMPSGLMAKRVGNLHAPRPRCGSAAVGANRGGIAAPAAPAFDNFWAARDPLRPRGHDAWLYR